MPKGYKAQFDFSGSRNHKYFKEYKNMETDYLTASIWCEDSSCMEDERYALINAIKELTLPERKILLTYADCGTYAETARLFGVNAKTVKNYIAKLKNKILGELKEDGIV